MKVQMIGRSGREHEAVEEGGLGCLFLDRSSVAVT